MSLMRNPRHSPDLRPSDFQADPIKRLPTVQPNVIEQRELLTNLHLARARTDLAPAEIPSPKRRVLPAYPPSTVAIATNFLWGSAPVQVLAAGRFETRSIST